MSVKTHIPDYLRPVTGNKGVVEVEGSTIGECLSHVVRQFPDIEEHLFSEDGKLPIHLDIWINGESAYPEELLKPVLDGDEIYIVGGGSG